MIHYNPETGWLYWKIRDSNRRGDGAFNTRHAGRRAFTADSGHGYCVGNILNRKCYAHHIAFVIETGEWPDGEVDHIDGNRSNNRFSNLRVVSHGVNAKNSALRSHNTSGAHGVDFHRQTGKWRARIAVDGCERSLGLYSDKSDAIAARKAAEMIYGYHPNHGRNVAQLAK